MYLEISPPKGLCPEHGFVKITHTYTCNYISTCIDMMLHLIILFNTSFLSLYLLF